MEKHDRRDDPLSVALLLIAIAIATLALILIPAYAVAPLATPSPTPTSHALIERVIRPVLYHARDYAHA